MYHGALRAVLNDAVRLDKLTRNVATLIKLPRLQKPERTAFTGADAERFLQHASTDRYFAIFATLLLAGVRPSEALALKWSDINAGTLRVQRALVWLPGKDRAPIFASTKTDRARTIALGERLVGVLQRHRVEQARWRLAVGGSYDSELNLVFGTELGGPLQLHNVVRAFKKILRRATLKDMRLYDLRHSHATMLHAMGVPVKVIQSRLGHASITLTLDTYVHDSPGMQEEAAGQLDALLASTNVARAVR
jgi:integrase